MIGRLRSMSVLLAVFALALTGPACGSSDDDDEGGGASASNANGGDSPVAAGTEKEIRTVYAKSATSLENGRYQGVCSTYSDAFKQRDARQTAKLYGKPPSGRWDCVTALRVAYKGSGKVIPSPLETIRMVDSTRAVAATERKATLGAKSGVAFVKAGGDWKIDGPTDSSK